MEPEATIDHDAPTPVYGQLVAIMRARIESGDWMPGRRIPSETQLVQTYGIARGTVRKALGILIDEGVLFTVHGRGTFVATPGEPGSE